MSKTTPIKTKYFYCLHFALSYTLYPRHLLLQNLVPDSVFFVVFLQLIYSFTIWQTPIITPENLMK